MIDSHCHLENSDYDADVDDVVEMLKAEGMKAVVSVAAHPRDFEKALAIKKRHEGFVFLAAAVHPAYVKELSDDEINAAFDWIRRHKDDLVAVGEQGLDRSWVKELDWQEKQKELFVRSIRLAKELDKVVMVHSREANPDVVDVLESENAKKVHLHMWGGLEQIDRVVKNGWYISVGPVAATSKKHKKIIRDMPMDKILLETDSPWFGGKDAEGKNIRGTPLNIRVPAEKIAEVKGLSVDDVLKACAENAIRLYGLSL